MRESFETNLPDWVGETLRAPMDSDPASRARIMDAVRTLPAPRSFAPPMRASRWMRRGLLSPVVGAITTLCLTVAVMLRVGTAVGGTSGIEAVTRVLGDSIVPHVFSARDISHSVDSATWMDTLRVVEFVIRGSTVHAASVVGTFNRWQRGATPLRSEGDGVWRTRALIPRDVLDVAFLVNNAQLIPTSLQSIVGRE